MDQAYVLESSKFVIADALPTFTCAIPRNKDISSYAHLEGVRVIELQKKHKVSLIIGTNEPSAHVPDEVKRGSRFQPQGLKTPFGWTVVSTGSSNSNQCAFVQKDNDELHALLQKMYNHDFQDTHIEKTAPSRNDLQAVKVWEKSVKLVNG